MFYYRPFPGPITLESDMKSHSSAPRWAIPFVLLALLVLGLLFVPECDDCYFIFWKFDSWQDLLLTRPNTQDALVVGVPHNGRYLGNLLGVLQAKLYITPLAFLRGVLLGGALISLVLLLALACCLFMETVTIYLALAALAVLTWAWFFCRDRLPGATALEIGRASCRERV